MIMNKKKKVKKDQFKKEKNNRVGRVGRIMLGLSHNINPNDLLCGKFKAVP